MSYSYSGLTGLQIITYEVSWRCKGAINASTSLSPFSAPPANIITRPGVKPITDNTASVLAVHGGCYRPKRKISLRYYQPLIRYATYV